MIRLIIALFLLLSIMGVGPVHKKEEIIELNGPNTVIYDQAVDSVSVDVIISAILGKRILLPPTETLYLVLVSPGGSTGDSLVLKEIISEIPNLAVICKYCGSASGMLFVTFPHARLALKNSEVVLHEMFIDHVTAKLMANRSEAIQLQIASDSFDALIYSVLGMPQDNYEKLITGKEWHVKGSDLIPAKMADKLVSLHCDKYVQRLAPHTCDGT